MKHAWNPSGVLCLRKSMCPPWVWRYCTASSSSSVSWITGEKESLHTDRGHQNKRSQLRPMNTASNT